MDVPRPIDRTKWPKALPDYHHAIADHVDHHAEVIRAVVGESPKELAQTGRVMMLLRNILDAMTQAASKLLIYVFLVVGLVGLAKFLGMPTENFLPMLFKVLGAS